MLRRTNISLLVAAGGDPAWIMAQVGHTDPTLTLRIHAQVMKRKRSEECRAKANELFGAVLPTAANRPTDPTSAYAPALYAGPENDETPAGAGASEESG